MHQKIRYLLLQTRNPDDPMREQEVRRFSRALHCDIQQIEVRDLLTAPPSAADLDKVDAVLLGGSGHYSVAEGGPWLERALDAMRQLHAKSKPTFASCWGFQAMAQAMGGQVVTDMNRAELGSLRLNLTPAGAEDPVFGPLPSPFLAQAGHQDIVDELPADAVLLASTDRVTNQAFRFAGKPIYCTQFHPELNRDALIERLVAYPEYVEAIAGVGLDKFFEGCLETPDTEKLLERFVQTVFR